MNGQTATTIEQKKSYLDLLAVGYYVVGGLAALFSCFALLYVGLGGAMMVQPHVFKPDAPPAFVGCFLVAIGGIFLILGWALAATMVYAGRCLAKREKYTFALVTAVVSCIIAPFGTILGILSLILLLQPDVKALFEGQAPAAAPTAPTA